MSKKTEKPSGLPNIFIDPLTPEEFRDTRPGSQAGWELNVRLALMGLHDLPPNQVSRAVLNALTYTGRKCVIRPFHPTEQVKANAAAADWTPTEAELAEIDAIVPPPPVP